MCLVCCVMVPNRIRMVLLLRNHVLLFLLLIKGVL